MQFSSKWMAALFGFSALLFWNGQKVLNSPETTQERTILAVIAHPDDEMTISPILSRFAREEDQVYLAVATDGRYGVTEHAGIPAGDSLASVRAEEIKCSAEKLGIEPPILFGLKDGFAHKSPELSNVLEDFQQLHKNIRELFEELKPDVVMTWGPDGGYGHPDHRTVSNIVTEVYQLGGKEWPQELLYTGVPTNRFETLPEFSRPILQWFVDLWHSTSPEYLPVRIPYDETDLKNARQSIGCHKSQFTTGDMDELIKLFDHVYNGEVTLRPWSGDGKTAMNLLE